jgi:hypothetical protein
MITNCVHRLIDRDQLWMDLMTAGALDLCVVQGM